MIPFKTNKLTEGVNPLKIYEYLAMGLPVVSTDILELRNMPNVFMSKNKSDFLNNINIALNTRINIDNINNWLEKNTWNARIDKLLELVNS